MNPSQCPTCIDYWLNEGRPVGNYLIVSRGGHIPRVQHNDPAQEPAAAVPEQYVDAAPAEAMCPICVDYWVNEGRPRDHYLIVSGGGHIPGVHDDPAPELPAQCEECAEYWVSEGRPMNHYLIISRGGHIPGVHDRSYSPNQTTPEAAGTSQVPESNAAELHNVINRLISQVNRLETRLSMIESRVGDRFEEPRTGFDSESSSPGSRGHE